MKLFENAEEEIRKANEKFELEMDVGEDFYKFLKSIVEGNRDNELFVLNEDVSSKITITPKSNKSITLYIRDTKSGGKSNAPSQHSSSLKILKPEKYNGVSIIIPKNGKELDIEAKGFDKDTVIRDLKPAIEFVEKNSKLLDILWSSSDKPWKQKKVLTQLVNKNKDITNITVDGILKDELEDKLKEKIDDRK